VSAELGAPSRQRRYSATAKARDANAPAAIEELRRIMAPVGRGPDCPMTVSRKMNGRLSTAASKGGGSNEARVASRSRSAHRLQGEAVQIADFETPRRVASGPGLFQSIVDARRALEFELTSSPDGQTRRISRWRLL